ncbi:hypothetical protein N9Y42_09875, partial [Mariniblastus sp.]|nr:hypothetical protein [Mariniblastus sp.]
SFLDSMLSRLTTHQYDGASENERQKMLDAIGRLKTRDESDPSIALLDCWASIADVLSFYQQYIANEGFLATATERRSTYELAKQVGYRLKPGLSASTYLAFNIDKNQLTEDKRELLIPQGTAAKTIGAKPQTFETSVDIVARPEWNQIKPRVSQLPNLQAANINNLEQLSIVGVDHSLSPGDYMLFAFDVSQGIKSKVSSGNVVKVVREVRDARKDSEKELTYITFKNSPLSTRAWNNEIEPILDSITSDLRADYFGREMNGIRECVLEIRNVLLDYQSQGLAELDSSLVEKLEALPSMQVNVEQLSPRIKELGSKILQLESSDSLRATKERLQLLFGQLKDCKNIANGATDLSSLKSKFAGKHARLAKIFVDESSFEQSMDAIDSTSELFANFQMNTINFDAQLLEVTTMASVIQGLSSDLNFLLADPFLEKLKAELREDLLTLIGPYSTAVGWRVLCAATINGHFGLTNRGFSEGNLINDIETIPTSHAGSWETRVKAVQRKYWFYPVLKILRKGKDVDSPVDKNRKAFLTELIKWLDALPELRSNFDLPLMIGDCLQYFEPLVVLDEPDVFKEFPNLANDESVGADLFKRAFWMNEEPSFFSLVKEQGERLSLDSSFSELEISRQTEQLIVDVNSSLSLEFVDNLLSALDGDEFFLQTCIADLENVAKLFRQQVVPEENGLAKILSQLVCS